MKTKILVFGYFIFSTCLLTAQITPDSCIVDGLTQGFHIANEAFPNDWIKGIKNEYILEGVLFILSLGGLLHRKFTIKKWKEDGSLVLPPKTKKKK